MKLDYKSATSTDAFYVLTAQAVQGEGEVTRRKARVRGRLENLNGKLCIEAEGLFVVPKGYQLEELSDDF